MASEEELAAAALLEGLTASAPVAFALVAEDGEPVLATASLAGLAGVEELACEVLATGRPASERELQSVGGRSFVASAQPLEHGGRTLAAVMAVDFTAHARTEAALRESERALSDAQRMARMGWWVLWPQSGVAVQSPALLELLDMDRAAERALSDALREQGRLAMAAGESVDFRYELPRETGRCAPCACAATLSWAAAARGPPCRASRRTSASSPTPRRSSGWWPSSTVSRSATRPSPT